MIETHLRQDEAVVCKPWGDLDWRTSVSLRHAVHDALRPGGYVLIDLSRVTYIDAVGLSAIVGTLRRARAVGAVVGVYNMQPRVRRRMELVGMASLVGSLPDAHSNDAG
jgi:anti-sigma B factor antagonist